MDLRPAFSAESLSPGRLLSVVLIHPVSTSPAVLTRIIVALELVATLSRDHSMVQVTPRPASCHRLSVSSRAVPRALPSVLARRTFMCTWPLPLLLRWDLRIRIYSSAGTEL